MNLCQDIHLYKFWSSSWQFFHKLKGVKQNQWWISYLCWDCFGLSQVCITDDNQWLVLISDHSMCLLNHNNWPNTSINTFTVSVVHAVYPQHVSTSVVASYTPNHESTELVSFFHLEGEKLFTKKCVSVWL